MNREEMPDSEPLLPDSDPPLPDSELLLPDSEPPIPDSEPLLPVETTPPPAPLGRRLNRAFGPVIAGIIIDAVDVATFGPVGYLAGLPLGSAAGYWMGRCLGLSRMASFYCALAAGVYCMFPLTEMLPVATLVGACVRFLESNRKPPDDSGIEN
jgi:hypothetical protein